LVEAAAVEDSGGQEQRLFEAFISENNAETVVSGLVDVSLSKVGNVSRVNV